MKKTIATLALMTGCVTARPVTMPNGQAGWYIECPRDQGVCLEEAGRRCPAGYDVLNAGDRSGTYISSSPATGQATAMPIYRGTMTIQCRAAPVPAAAQ